MIRYLRAGKPPKEIAMLIHKSTSAIWLMIYRYQEVKTAYVDTYRLRYPHKEEPPARYQSVSA